MTLLNLILRLLFAHVLMDFIFQSTKMVKAKTSGTKGNQLKNNILHSLLHAAAAYLVVGQWTWWYIPLVIFISHFAIDYLYKRNKDGVFSFIVDQALHIAVILALAYITTQQVIDFDLLSKTLENNRFWMLILAYILITKPASIFIGKFISRWKPQINKQSNEQLTSDEEKGLDKAGEWIGYIERFLILTFVLIGQWGAIGFLLAAKSIFRYGDLKENKDIRMTEYVLIGTLCSFAIAIVIGIILS